MRPRIAAAYRRLFDRFPIHGAVLEVGPPADMDQSLLRLLADRSHEGDLVGIDRLPRLKVPPRYRVVQGDGSEMAMFGSKSFGAVISHAALEHDASFWSTVKEMRRVLAPGGLLFVSVPGVPRLPNPAARLVDRMASVRRSVGAGSPRDDGEAPSSSPLVDTVRALRRSRALVSVPTYRTHEAIGVGDYWRFTERAVREVLLEHLELLSLESIGRPVMWVAVGRSRADPISGSA